MHLAHKAEHAVDLETGAIVGVTVQDADDGDAETSVKTLITAAEQIEAVLPEADGLQEVVGDKGYHSNQSLVDLEAVGVRSYISEPDRGRRNWTNKPVVRAAVYRNRRRIRGPRGLRLLRLRGERLERPFAHLYETGGLRRAHLRGHTNILKRLLIHTGGFNLGLLMRQLIGVDTPRGLQGTAQHGRDRAACANCIAQRACHASSAVGAADITAHATFKGSIGHRAHRRARDGFTTGC
jgi:transposase